MRVRAVKVGMLTGVSHLTRLLVFLFIIKQIALIHGPEGLGLLGNFMSLVSVASTLAGGGLVSGIIKYLAESKGALYRQECLMGSALVYTLIFSVLTLLIGLLGRHWLTRYVFTTEAYLPYMYLFLVAQVVIALNNCAYGILNGLEKNAHYAVFLIVGNLTALVVAYYGIQFYGVPGAIIAILAPSIFPFIPIVFYVLSQGALKSLRFDSWRSDSRLLSQFSLMLFVSAICFPIVEMLIRNKVIAILGIEAAGFWQAMTKLSTAYLSFYSLFLSFYFLPVMSPLVQRERIMKEVNYTLFFLGISFLAIILFFFFFKTLIIRLVLSSDFLPMSDLLLLQMVGDLFRIMSWVFGFVVLAKSAIKLYLLGEFIQGGLFIVLSDIMLRHGAQLQSVVLAYVYTCVIYFILSVLVFTYVYRETKVISLKGADPG